MPDETGPHAGSAPKLAVIAAAYLVGPDTRGRWLAVETHGRGGGLFVDADAALHFAQSETAHRPGAVRLVAGPLQLGFA